MLNSGHFQQPAHSQSPEQAPLCGDTVALHVLAYLFVAILIIALTWFLVEYNITK